MRTSLFASSSPSVFVYGGMLLSSARDGWWKCYSVSLVQLFWVPDTCQKQSSCSLAEIWHVLCMFAIAKSFPVEEWTGLSLRVRCWKSVNASSSDPHLSLLAYIITVLEKPFAACGNGFRVDWPVFKPSVRSRKECPHFKALVRISWRCTKQRLYKKTMHSPRSVVISWRRGTY